MFILLKVTCLLIFFMESSNCRETLKRYRRIAGGSKYEISKMPYLVSLRYNKSYFCSGSIINDSSILTAATCNKPEVQRIKVRVGSNFFQQKGKTIKASIFIQHPEFDNETLENDVAIIVLQEKMNFTKNIRPARLPPQDCKLPNPGERVRIAGWGYFDPTSGINSSEEMRSVNVPIMSKETCKTCFPDRDITEGMFCAGYILGGAGPSIGDIGSPVVYKGIQYGVVSFAGDSGAFPLSPAVFTSVPKVRGFIQQYTKLASNRGINSSEEMRSVKVSVMPKERCKTCFPDRNITEGMFCAGYFLGGAGPSTGDIGSPVVYKGIQYGVVSFAGDSGAYPLSPAVFTSVPKVRGFIQQYIKLASNREEELQNIGRTKRSRENFPETKDFKDTIVEIAQTTQFLEVYVDSLLK